MADNLPQSSVTSEQRIGFVLLLVFGMLAVGLGVLQMRNNIYGPFVVKSPSSVGQAQVILDETTRLQKIDTDQDGLNDFEELNFYQTSPYLPDTDSDGIFDKEETQRGTDPLCPEGSDCSTNEAFLASDTTVSDFVSPLVADQPLSIDIVEEASKQTAAQFDNFGLEELGDDPERLRELLIQTGRIDKEQLDAITDTVLIDLFGSVSENTQ